MASRSVAALAEGARGSADIGGFSPELVRAADGIGVRVPKKERGAGPADRAAGDGRFGEASGGLLKSARRLGYNFGLSAKR